MYMCVCVCVCVCVYNSLRGRPQPLRSRGTACEEPNTRYPSEQRDTHLKGETRPGEVSSQVRGSRNVL